MADSSNLGLEHSFYWGILATAMLYGIEVYMFVHSTSLFLGQKTSPARPHRVYILLGFLILVCITIAAFVNFVFLQNMWIDHRDVAGGPLGYFAAKSKVWWQILGTVTDQIANYLGDALLIFRCYVIWGGTYSIIVIPGILYLATIAMGIMTVVQSASPGVSFYQEKANFAIPWSVLAVSLNLFCTAVITFRLLRARQMMRDVGGAIDRRSFVDYTGIVGILVESSLPFSILGIVFAVTLAKGMDAAPALTFVWGTFCGLSPQMIIFRVAMGRAWSRDVATQISTQVLFFQTENTQPTLSVADSHTKIGRSTHRTSFEMFGNTRGSGFKSESSLSKIDV